MTTITIIITDITSIGENTNMQTQVGGIFSAFLFMVLLQAEVGTASETTASELDTSCIDSESDAMRLESDGTQ